MAMARDINPVELEFLLRFPVVLNVTSPVDFLSNPSWGGIKVGTGRETYYIYICKVFGHDLYNIEDV